MAWLPHNFIQAEVSIRATCSNLFLLLERFERAGGKTCNIAFQLVRFAAMLQNKHYVSVARITAPQAM